MKNIHAAWLKVPTADLQEVIKQSWGADREEVTHCFSSPAYTLTEGNKRVGSREKLKGETQSPFLTLYVLVAKQCPAPTTPWTTACQASLSMGFSRKEYWSGLPFPPPGDLPKPGIKPRSPALQVDSVLSEPPGKHTVGIEVNLKKWSCSVVPNSLWPHGL